MDERIDQTALDRLVDGELSDDEYKAVVAALDDEPGDWRRCAMAFLESQALTRDLGIVRERMQACPAVPEAAPQPSSQNQWGGPAKLLAVAASFLLAFSLGIVAPQFFREGPQDGGASGNLKTAGVLNQKTGDPSNSGLPQQALSPVGNVRLVMDGPSGETTTAENVPVYEVGSDLESYLSQVVPVLRPELIELLKQQGYDVQRHQQLFPAPLDDGRQLIVPVDAYQITPVSIRY